MITLYSCYVWVVWILLLILLGPVALLGVLASRQLGFRLVRFASRLAFLLAGIRVRVRGAELVDWGKAQVFMGNHQNGIDPFAMVLAVRRHMVGIEKASNFKIPVYGALVRAWGNIPIVREDPVEARKSLEVAARRLKEGISIAILPEGTRSKDGSIGPFKKGGFHLALDTGADIVPFTINGSFALFQTGGWKIRPGVIEVVFGKALSTAGYTKNTLTDLMDAVRAAICENFRG